MSGHSAARVAFESKLSRATEWLSVYFPTKGGYDYVSTSGGYDYVAAYDWAMRVTHPTMYPRSEFFGQKDTKWNVMTRAAQFDFEVLFDQQVEYDRHTLTEALTICLKHGSINCLRVIIDRVNTIKMSRIWANRDEFVRHFDNEFKSAAPTPRLSPAMFEYVTETLQYPAKPTMILARACYVGDIVAARAAIEAMTTKNSRFDPTHHIMASDNPAMLVLVPPGSDVLSYKDLLDHGSRRIIMSPELTRFALPKPQVRMALWTKGVILERELPLLVDVDTIKDFLSGMVTSADYIFAATEQEKSAGMLSNSLLIRYGLSLAPAAAIVGIITAMIAMVYTEADHRSIETRLYLLSLLLNSQQDRRYLSYVFHHLRIGNIYHPVDKSIIDPQLRISQKTNNILLIYVYYVKYYYSLGIPPGQLFEFGTDYIGRDGIGRKVAEKLDQYRDQTIVFSDSHGLAISGSGTQHSTWPNADRDSEGFNYGSSRSAYTYIITGIKDGTWLRRQLAGIVPLQ